MVVYRDGKTLARVGVMGESPVVQDAQIMKKCIREGRNGREQYLAALQVCPTLLHSWTIHSFWEMCCTIRFYKKTSPTFCFVFTRVYN